MARLDLTAVEEAFAALLLAGPADRPAVLAALCGDRADLLAELESLLAAHDVGSDLLVPPSAALADPTLTDHSTQAPAGSDPSPFYPGTRIGAFRLLERIARGGMGDVYRAERVEGGFAQQAAVKFIAGRLQSADTVRRFVAERQILASLQHPNIVGLLDGGVTPDGQPYLVMEYVDGLPITKHCRKHALSLDARLKLFRQVCAVVGFAHRHLVVHRDLKPGNIFVTIDGAVKVLDFGVAKLLEPDGTAPAATIPLLVPLTPNYASPEQLRGLPAGTACDVYALGIVLYELTTGVLPYDIAGKPLEEILKVVLEFEPLRPSAVPHAATSFDARQLRGDIDAIVLKALAKDVEARYASVEDFGDDLLRHLDGRPVLAREPSFAYLARRAIARHRMAFSVVSVSLILLIAALVGAVWQARVAAGERERAIARFNDVRELASALIFRIHDEVEPLPGSTAVRQTVIAEGLKFLERLAGDSAGDASLQLELARAYIRIGDVQGRVGAANLGDRDAALRSYQFARDLVEPFATDDDSSWDAATTLVTANLRLSNLLASDGAPAARAALQLALRRHQLEPDAIRSTELLARAQFGMAATFGASRDSLPHWLEADRLFNAVLARDPGNLNKIRNAALTAKYIGTQFEVTGDLAKALEHYERASVLDETRTQAAPADRVAQLDLAIDISNIGSVREKRGEFDAAIEAFGRSLDIRERLASSDPNDVNGRFRVAFGHGRLGWVHLKAGALGLARRHAMRAIELYKPSLGSPPSLNSYYADALSVVAAVDAKEGRRHRACTGYRDALHSYDLAGPLTVQGRGASENRARVASEVKACDGR